MAGGIEICRIHKGDFIKDRISIKGVCACVCLCACECRLAPRRTLEISLFCVQDILYVYGVCPLSVCSSLCARLHSLMCTVGVQVRVRLDVLLIVCQAKTSFKKSVQRAPYGALMLECAVKRGGDRGKENEGREGERENEEAFSLAFLPLSLSSPMSKTDGAGALCVCICV